MEKKKVVGKEELSALGLRSAGGELFIQSPTFQKVYANNVQLGLSIFDMNLVFGEMIAVSEDGHTVVEQKVKINMSKEFIKALQNLLNKNISEFERVYGEIKIPSAMKFQEVDLIGSGETPKKPTQSKKKS